MKGGSGVKREKFYVTTPIYYVNDKPHIGHAYTTILADVLARYYRLFGVPTRFLTGTDEHGQKVQMAAFAGGISPQEQADRTVVRFQKLWEKLEISHDDFIRTTEERHTEVVQRLLQQLYDQGEIYRADYNGWYCVTCERFYTQKDLVEGVCPEPGCGREVEPIKEANYFFRMSKYQDWLMDYINQYPDFIQPEFRRNETLGFLKKGLNDLCISRPKSRMDWGVELPFDEQFVTYVWFDALVNYISAVGHTSDEKEFRKWWPADYHLIGKDILTTHTVYWPTMLKAMGLEMPRAIFAHGWWLAGQDKMSKSRGNVINPIDFVDRYGVDAFRYFVISEMTLGQDASFTEEGFIRRYNSDLANDLGNMLNRVMKLISKHCNGRVPQPGQQGEAEESLKSSALDAAENMAASVENMRLDQGVQKVAGVVREANRYFETRQPWVLAKQGESEELGTVLYTGVEALRIVSGLLYPVMPAKMNDLRSALGIREGYVPHNELDKWGVAKPGTEIGKMPNLFPRAKPPAAGAKKEKGAGPEASKENVVQIEYADFEKIGLKVARVLTAEKVKDTDKLMQLTLDAGGEKRQVVAGIARYYAPEDLAGRNVVIVANLKPARIKGIESNGMLLAANSGGNLRLLTTDGEIEPGSRIS
jgi:methionyl-tRNA synthetase